MNKDEAGEIVDKYHELDDYCCSCHMGNPPCSKCVDCPSEEDYKEACKILEIKDKI